MDNKLITIIVLGVIVILGLFMWLKPVNSSPITPNDDNNKINMTDGKNKTAVVTTNLGVFEIELFTEQMPITTGNFIKLAESGFYNDTRFHRVIPNFMIQGGDPLTRDQAENIASHGTGGPGYMIEDEFVTGLSNVRGTISMANSGQPNSGGSQFFINVADNVFLDFDKEPLSSKHPVFGQVISGMEIVDKISGVATRPDGEGSYPAEPVVIEKVEIK